MTIYQIVYIDQDIDRTLPVRMCPSCAGTKLGKVPSVVKKRVMWFCRGCRRHWDVGYQVECNTLKAPDQAILP